MFKTIEECRLDLVAHTAMVDPLVTNLKGKHLLKQNADSGDYFPCSAARVSFGNEDKTGEDARADYRLMKYLADHEHMTPFEHQSATFLVEVPLFIRSQIMRHRTFAYNEISRRYTDENLEFWIPTTFRKQSDSNRQASTDEAVKQDPENWQHYIGLALGYYYSLIESGVSREQARAILPQSLLTKFYMSGNLRNWAHFIKLRKDAHAQKEVQVVANRIEAELRKLWPTSAGVLLDG